MVCVPVWKIVGCCAQFRLESYNKKNNDERNLNVIALLWHISHAGTDSECQRWSVGETSETHGPVFLRLLW